MICFVHFEEKIFKQLIFDEKRQKKTDEILLEIVDKSLLKKILLKEVAKVS